MPENRQIVSTAQLAILADALLDSDDWVTDTDCLPDEPDEPPDFESVAELRATARAAGFDHRTAIAALRCLGCGLVPSAVAGLLWATPTLCSRCFSPGRAVIA